MLAQRLVISLLIALLAAPLAACASTEDASAFLADLNDVPLAPGLVEVEAERLVFDKPEGRIVQAAATGKRPVEEIGAFYRETLPQLGWRAVPPDRAAAVHAGPEPDDGAAVERLLFARDAERLEIILETVYETLVVRFSLEPRQ
ncbi:MAG TPA: hypothetical protein VIK87_07510 [Sphingomonadales bacterium]